MTAPDFRTALRARGPETWIALLGLGMALSPTHTKIAGATWLLLCIAGAVACFRLPRPVVSTAPDAVEAASRAWVMACLVCAGLATGVWLYWPDPPDTLHAEFRLLLAAAATHQLIQRASDPKKWRAFTLPATALACGAALVTIAPLPDKMLLPANPIPWAVSVAFLLCVMLPVVLGDPLPPAHRKWYAVSVAMGLVAIVVCHTRGAYAILVWAPWLAATNWRRAHATINLRKFVVAGFAGLAILGSSAWLPSDPLRLRQGWNEVVTAERDGNYSTSMGARMYGWSLAWKSFQESPWVGLGGKERLRRLKEAGLEAPDLERAQLALVRKLGHVHNQYLHSAMDGGLIGLAATLAVVAGLGAAAFALRRADPVASRQMQGVLLLHATAGLTNVNLAHNYYAVMLSLSVAVILAGAGAPIAALAAAGLKSRASRSPGPFAPRRPLPMHILFVNKASIPVVAYGGTERVIWDLGKNLVRMGHQVSYLVPQGSYCDFARVIPIRPGLGWREQVPDGIDLVHFQFNPEGADDMDAPYLVTQHGNSTETVALPRNTVFVSRNHAQRHGSTEYVYNGLDWEAYGPVDFSRPRTYFHFLGKAAWRVKNVRGAIDVATDAGVELLVLGGNRLNLKRGFRFTWSRRVRFAGMVGGQQKLDMLNGSRGMIFPVLWHEPFGLAVIESLYFGCPVFATPYGALPELVPQSCGVLSDSRSALSEAVRQSTFDAQACHRHAVAHFGAQAMARGYLEKYARILDGEVLNPTAPVMTANPKALTWRK